MTTHYDVLGVDRSASYDDVRAAYRRAARRHHPDAGGEAATGERMAALNEAWRVLGHRDLRREYDRTLDAPTTAGVTSHETVRPVPLREPRYNPLARYQDPPRVPWGPMGVVAGLGALAVVVASAISPASPDQPVDGPVTVGDCVSIDGSGTARVTLCDGSHDGTVESIVTDSLQCPQHTEAHPVVGDAALVCVRV